ncbi:membrane protein insertase YidC [Mesomycoplasma molare]|uniref:Membrane protein insertase YidC n=1 Tax=Mesomycoplasma molare TaxID=171288 RepID=A0ABY5TXF8_9BACT|nr:membrane protein insertase YidC [Mesomycoplasma molare]UWD34206.1 membrane protein insertase YidC [Mesomycoplasma molare]
MEKKKNRPKSYDFFSGKNNPENKNIIKKIWKWFKIFIYTFIFGVTLTGCIQSFVIKTANNTGAGVEFYNSKEGVSPNAVIFEKNTRKDGVEEITIVKENKNFFVSNQDSPRKEIIETLNKQTNGKYGLWGNYNTLIVERDDQGNYLYPGSLDVSGQKIEEYLFFNSDADNYKQKIQWTEFSFVPENIVKQLETHDSKYINEKDPNINNYFINVKDYIIPNTDRIDNYNIFARDVLEFLNSKIKNLKIYNEGKLDKAIAEVKTKGKGASQEDLNLVINYSQNLKEVLKNTHFSKFYDSSVFFEPEKINNINDYSKMLAYRSSEPQKVIITWGDSWKLGPFYGLFIWPMSKLMTSILDSMSLEATGGWSAILTIIIAVLLTKIISFIFRFKTLFTQSKQQELQAKKAKIDAKYAQYKGNKQMEARQRQEISELYKKNNVSPVAQLQQAFITMPIFIAMWRILQGLPAIKSTTWLGINLASTSYQELFAGKWIYLPILLITIIIQLVQQLLPKFLNRKQNKRLMNASETEALKKQQKTQNYMIIIFILFGVLFQASLQVYWIVGGIWEIGQILFVHYFQRTNIFKEKVRPWINKPKKFA